MNWLQQTVNLYQNHTGGTRDDNVGTVRTLREILFSDFSDNIGEIVALRALNRSQPDYESKKRRIKARLRCFTIGALLRTRKKDVSEPDRILRKTGLTQIDIDHIDSQGFDIDELKQFIFSFPFVCFVSQSCSGDGLFAIISIAEPNKNADYLEHLHKVFDSHKIEIDTSKGKNYSDMRYVSYDENMLYRPQVTPLRVDCFPKKEVIRPSIKQKQTFKGSTSGLIRHAVNRVLSAQVNQRWEQVGIAAAALGNAGSDGLDEIETAIHANPAFAGLESKYIKRAQVCYELARANPRV